MSTTTEPRRDAEITDASPSDAEMSAEPVLIDQSVDARDTGTFASLRERSYARYLAAYVPSMTGNWIRITAMGYLVYDLTSDPFKLGMINFATSVPQLILSPISGAVIDKVNRRRLLVTVQFLIITLMCTIAWLVHSDNVTYPRLLAIAITLGCLITFDWPVRVSLIPSLVDRSVLQNAIALNSTTFNVAKVFGPTLAGWLIALVGMAWAFGMTAMLMVPFPFVILSLSRLKHVAPPSDAPQLSPLQQITSGYRYIWTTPDIRALLATNLVPIVLGMSYIAMAPAYVQDVLHQDAKSLGYLLAANGFGAFIGTFSVARFGGLRRRGRAMLLTIATYSTLLVAFGLTSQPLIAYVLVALVGASYGFASALNDTLIQLLVDDGYRGRVMSVYAMLWGMSPAGALLAGWLANVFNVQWAIAISGILVLLYIPYLLVGTTLRHID